MVYYSYKLILLHIWRFKTAVTREKRCLNARKSAHICHAPSCFDVSGMFRGCLDACMVHKTIVLVSYTLVLKK